MNAIQPTCLDLLEHRAVLAGSYISCKLGGDHQQVDALFCSLDGLCITQRRPWYLVGAMKMSSESKTEIAIDNNFKKV